VGARFAGGAEQRHSGDSPWSGAYASRAQRCRKRDSPINDSGRFAGEAMSSAFGEERVSRGAGYGLDLVLIGIHIRPRTRASATRVTNCAPTVHFVPHAARRVAAATDIGVRPLVGVQASRRAHLGAKVLAIRELGRPSGVSARPRQGCRPALPLADQTTRSATAHAASGTPASHPKRSRRSDRRKN
jgi:hypothetical protein